MVIIGYVEYNSEVSNEAILLRLFNINNLDYLS